MAPIKTARAGSRPTKRLKTKLYTQAEVDAIVRDRLQSYHLIACELRSLILELARTRHPGRMPKHTSVDKTALLRVLSKSADLADL